MNMIISLVGLFIIGMVVISIILVIVLIARKKNTTQVQHKKITVKKSLGESLKEHRLRCNMTQEFVAESLGVSRQAVSKWETGESDPSTSNLLALAKVFNVSASELLESVE